MAQFGRPYLDIATNGWTASSGSALYAMVDEISASDTDYIQNNAVALAEVQLTSLSTPTSGSHYVRYRMGRSRVDRTLTLVVRLMQGAVEIASWTHVDPALAFTSASQVLTSGQVSAISDYSDLRLRFDITAIQNNQVFGQVSWAEIEIPDASTEVIVSGQTTMSGNEEHSLFPNNVAVSQVLSYGSMSMPPTASNLIPAVASLDGVSISNLLNLLISQTQLLLSGGGDLDTISENIEVAFSDFSGYVSTEFISPTVVKIFVSWARFILPESLQNFVYGLTLMPASAVLLSNTLVNILSSAVANGNLDVLLDSLLNMQSIIEMVNSAELITYPIVDVLSSASIDGIGYLIASGIVQRIVNASIDLNSQAVLIGQALQIIDGISFLTASGDISSQTRQIISALLQGYGIGELIGYVSVEGLVLGQVLLGGIFSYQTLNAFSEIKADTVLLGQVAELVRSAVEIYAQSIIDGNQDHQLSARNLISLVSEFLGQLAPNIIGKNYNISSTTIQGELSLMAQSVSYVNALMNAIGSFDFIPSSTLLIPAMTELDGEAFLYASGIFEAILRANVSFSGQSELVLTALNIASGKIDFDGRTTSSLQALLGIISRAILDGSVSGQLAGQLLVQIASILSGLGILQPIGDIVTSVIHFTPLERVLIVTAEDRTYIIDQEGRIYVINEEDRTYWISKYR